MAIGIRGCGPRQQRMLRPLTFLTAIGAFMLSMGVLSPFGALLVALVAGFAAGLVNERVHKGTLLARLLSGACFGLLVVLGLHLCLGVPFFLGGAACAVLYVLS